MSLQLVEVHHVQLTVPLEALEDAKAFYADVLGLETISRPVNLSKGGAWFQKGAFQLHLSAEPITREANEASKRHVCFRVRDLRDAEAHLRHAGVAILPDANPVPDWPRFYVRDPGGNRIEIAQDATV